jgi:predicted RNA-binding Zn-ribbon protein involved in translation (DUF1610 family)
MDERLDACFSLFSNQILNEMEDDEITCAEEHMYAEEQRIQDKYNDACCPHCGDSFLTNTHKFKNQTGVDKNREYLMSFDCTSCGERYVTLHDLIEGYIKVLNPLVVD